MRPALRVLPRPASRQSLLTSGHRAGPWSSARTLAGTARRNDDNHDKTHSLNGYVADLLDAPLHSVEHATRTAPEAPPKENLPMTQREETLAKARVVFGGSRLSSAEERKHELESKSQWIAGVLVPPKPEEPDNCCMSGCVNCVWELFREELEEWAAKSTEAKQKMIEQRTKGTATGMMAQESGMPKHAAVSMDDDGGGSETNWSTAPETEVYDGTEGSVDPLAGIPVGIREFMKTEKKLKARHKAAGEVMDTALDKDLRASVWRSGART